MDTSHTCHYVVWAPSFSVYWILGNFFPTQSVVSSLSMTESGMLIGEIDHPSSRQEPSLQRVRICSISLMLAATAFFLVISGCGGAGTPPTPQPVLDLSKHRDPLTNRVEPVLSDRATADPVGSVPTDFDYYEVDSPSVIEDPSRFPIFGDRFLLFYEGTDALLNYVIALVSSTEEDLDPLVIGRTVVMSPASMPDLIDNGTPIAPFGAADPTVIVNHSVLVNNPGRYQMWFEGTFGVNAFSLQSAILTCSSQDGITWTAPIFCTGLEPGALFGTVVRVADPSVLKTNEPSDAFRMAFEVERTDGSSVIGMAFSDDGIAWTIRDGVFNGPPAAPSFSGGPGTFDDFAVHAPTIAIEQDSLGNLIEWMLFYEGARSGTDNDTVIGYATSLDGYSWSGFQIPVLDPSSDLVSPPLFDSDDLKQPAVIQPNNYPGTDINGIPYPRFLLYYVGDPDIPGDRINRIGLASGS